MNKKTPTITQLGWQPFFQQQLSLEEFTTVCDRFTNKRVFEVDESGSLVKDDRGSLTKINYDNP